MEELTARAALAPDVGEGITTSVSREEIEEALRTDDRPLDLILDVTRFSQGEPTETRSVAVAWERSDLKQLLRQAEGERLMLTFDREALRQAVETDVEAHGIREKVLVLAVAATAATGAAATAEAEPGALYGSSGQAVPTAVSPDDRAVSRAMPVSAPDTVGSPDDRAVSRATTVSAPDTVGSPDDRAVLRATPVSVPDTVGSPDDRAVPRATPVSVPDTVGSPDDRAVPRATPVSAPDTTGGGISISAPSPAETATIAGAIALAITGAAFAAVSRRRVRPT